MGLSVFDAGVVIAGLDASDAHHAAATRAFEATRIGYGVPVTSFGRCR